MCWSELNFGYDSISALHFRFYTIAQIITETCLYPPSGSLQSVHTVDQNPYSMRTSAYDLSFATTHTRIFPDLIAVMQFFFAHMLRDIQCKDVITTRSIFYWNISLVCQCRWNNQSQSYSWWPLAQSCSMLLVHS